MGEESSVAVVVVEVEEVEPTVAEVAVVPAFAMAFPLELPIGDHEVRVRDTVILQPRRLHSMGPGYERLHILFHHDLNTQDSKTRQERQQVRSNAQPRKRILVA